MTSEAPRSGSTRSAKGEKTAGKPASVTSPWQSRVQSSRTAAVKLMCLECRGHDPAELRPGAEAIVLVRNCRATACPLHPWRPYRERVQ